MPVKCPKCGSANLRYAHLRNWTERLLVLLGKRPLRCRDCRARFVDRTWRFRDILYARCPHCWHMDLNRWSEEDYWVPAFTRFKLRLGGSPFRCEYCRTNFVSFRPRLERFSFSKRRQRGKPQQGSRSMAARQGGEGS
jgi:hypothetical protein